MTITKQCDCWLCRENYTYNPIIVYHSDNTPHYGLEADLIAEELGLPLIYQEKDDYDCSGTQDTSF